MSLNRRQFVRLAGTAAVVSLAGALENCGRVAERLIGTDLEPSGPGGIRKPGASPLSIGSSRYRVRNECWYSINRDWLRKGDDPNGPGGDGTKSNWNWLSKIADANGNGLRFALNTYQTCVSNDIPPVCGCCAITTPNLMPYPQNTIEYWVSYLSADPYGVRSGIGRGCQCVSYVAMDIYRATAGMYRLSWNWGSKDPSKYSFPPAINAQPCDLVFYNYVDGSGRRRQHVAVCVRNYGSGITVVDSNYLGYEMIGRHNVSGTAIGNTWKMFSGQGRWY
ncbi:MAG: hypothetical protein HYY50_03295 [Candidatus Kerfeldbacteria bacterium]|nr:hypothetical protein [Candidatus Kerfeldbacteria bacterium]